MEHSNRSFLSRRKFLLAVIGSGSAAILLACQGPAQPGATPVAGNTGGKTPAAGTPAAGSTPAAASTPKPTLEIPAATPTPAPTPEISTEIPPPAFPDIKYDNVPKLAYKGTIQFWPQAYLPTKPTGTTTKTPQYLNRIVADYQQLHPDIKISLERGPAAGDSSTTWTRTKAAGGQLMDITWQQGGSVNNDYPKGFFVDLTPYYNKPNPYIQKGQPGSDKWLDSIPAFVVDQAVRAPDGKMYQVNCDYVGTALFYNKDLFSASGVDPEKPLETWEDFMTALKKLKDTGKDNFTAQTFEMGTSNMWWSWYHRVAYTQLYADQFDKLNVDKQPFRLSNLAEAVAFINKDYDPSSERYQDAWRLFKDWSQYWDPGYLSGPDSYRAWVNSKTAIYWNGSWQIPQMLTNPTIKFKWGSFPIPSFTPTTSKFVQKGTKAPMVGGPSAAFQYSIATPQADQTMTPDKIEACVDWPMFLAAPQNSGPMVNDLGSFLPTVKGTKPLESLAPLISSMQNTEKQGGACELSGEEGDAYYRLIQEFMANRTSLGDTMQKVTPVIQAAVDKQARENKWDLSKYKR